MNSLFIRARETPTGVMRSTCVLCCQVVGRSANVEYLVVAEAAHNCRKRPKKEICLPQMDEESPS